jgi:hypothetical protein
MLTLWAMPLPSLMLTRALLVQVARGADWDIQPTVDHDELEEGGDPYIDSDDPAVLEAEDMASRALLDGAGSDGEEKDEVSSRPISIAVHPYRY